MSQTNTSIEIVSISKAEVVVPLPPITNEEVTVFENLVPTIITALESSEPNMIGSKYIPLKIRNKCLDKNQASQYEAKLKDILFRHNVFTNTNIFGDSVQVTYSNDKNCDCDNICKMNKEILTCLCCICCCWTCWPIACCIESLTSKPYFEVEIFKRSMPSTTGSAK